MSDLDEKDQKTKVRPKDDVPAGDKTVVHFAGAKTAWPDPDDTPDTKLPDSDSDADAPAVEAEADTDTETETETETGFPATDPWTTPEDAILSPAIETETINQDDEETAAVTLDEADEISPEPAGDQRANTGSEPAPFETDQTQGDTVSAPDEAIPATDDTDDEPIDTVFADATPADTEMPEDPEPPAETRIEVPVQQQYASLLAALSDRVQKHPGGHDLLAVLRMLEGQTAPGAAQAGMDPKKADEPAPPRIGKSRRLMEDIVRFGQDPTGEFATSTIERATRDADNGLILLERFLGMLGPQGALPSALNDEAIMRGLRGDDSLPRFLDVFNNRFIQLFFRAWADARPIVQHDRPDDDRFLAYLGSSIGIGGPIYQDLDGIDDRLKLLYAGLSSSKSKSAARLKALITGVFGVDVDIDQCVGTWLHLEPDDQLSIGGFGPGGAGQLGMDTIVGSKIYSVSDKIRIRIFTQSLDEYRKFLPPTRTKPNPWTEKLFDLIDFYLGLEIEYEIELALPRRCASAVRMDGLSSATLGHIGWLKPADTGVPDDAEFDDEENMLTDTRFRPVRRHTSVYQ